MGPRRWGRGRRHPCTSSMSRSACFNGATTLGSWKTRRERQPVQDQSTLQWGHDAGVVEDRRGRVATVRVPGCFNGATTLGSWKTRLIDLAMSGLPRGFNGATTLGSWKTTATVSTCPCTRSFNGATTLGSWKTPAQL